jgi:exosortase/archaeosortase family protein
MVVLYNLSQLKDELKSLLKNEGILFIVKFVLIFSVIYGGHLFYLGIIDPQGTLSVPFLQPYGAWYADAIRNTLLYASKFILQLGFNLHIQVIDGMSLAAKGKMVNINYECVGIGLYAFWAAFVLSHKQVIKTKLKWLIAGWFLLWMMNVTRICLVLAAMIKSWVRIENIDHHAVFNYCMYVLIFGLVLFYLKRTTGNNNDSISIPTTKLIKA